MGKETFIDANIFLEIFLKDEKSEECKNFLKSVSENEEVPVISDFILYSCIINVQNNLKSMDPIKEVIFFFSTFSNLKILSPSFDDYYMAIEIMGKHKLDFDDSLVVACMKNHGIKELVSFDRHFDKVKDINRIIL